MRPADLVRLVALAAIWGGSFMFVRYAAPVLDAAWLTELRVGLAALAMLVYVRAIGLDMQLHRRWRAYVALGLLNTTLPWGMYAWAGHHIGAAYMAILNSTTPWFGAICAAIWLGEALTARKLAGLAVRVAGVTLLVGFGPIDLTHEVVLAVGLSVLASLSYALGGTYAKRNAQDIPPAAITTGSLVVASLVVAPFLPGPPPLAVLASWKLAGAVLALSLVCSALAFLMFYRLLANVGPTKALTVTFLIPVFGVLWGTLFLGETIGLSTLAGGALIVAATALVAGGSAKA